MSPIHIGQVRETQKPCAWLAVCKKIEKEYKQTASETSFLEMARLQNHSFAEDLSFAIFFLYIYLICNNTEFQTLAHTSITLPELLAGPSAATLRCPVRPQPWFVCGLCLCCMIWSCFSVQFNLKSSKYLNQLERWFGDD